MKIHKKGIIKISLITVILLGLIIAWLGFGERGFIHLYRMDKERQSYQERIQNLEEANLKLLDEIKRLREDKEYIESIARKELGLIKENEIIYRFDDNTGATLNSKIAD
ncbi:MAG: septum formation initiator family protein [Deltaproteobacteria bacterium]|nr:septum formation initiator family protein [Deltaproteobacteria bacterium]